MRKEEGEKGDTSSARTSIGDGAADFVGGAVDSPSESRVGRRRACGGRLLAAADTGSSSAAQRAPARPPRPKKRRHGGRTPRASRTPSRSTRSGSPSARRPQMPHGDDARFLSETFRPGAAAEREAEARAALKDQLLARIEAQQREAERY